MNYILKPFEKFVNTITSTPPDQQQDRLLLYEQLAKKTERLEAVMLKDLLSQQRIRMQSTYFNVHMQKLVMLCDQLFDYENDYQLPNEFSLLVLEVLASMKKALPHLIGRELPLPKLFRVVQCPFFQREWEAVVAAWTRIEVDPLLMEIARLPVDEFCYSDRKLSWFHFVWLKKYLTELSGIDFSNFEPYPAAEYLIHDYMIRLNFNHIRFTGYCERVMQWHADQFSEREQQLFVLNMAKKVIGQLRNLSDEPFYDDGAGVKEELYGWIDLEIAFRNEFDAEAFLIQGEKVPVNRYKYVYSFKVEQLAFFQKTLLDHGILMEENIGTLCEKTAYNCSTKNQEELSPGSIRSKLYTKEPSVIRPIYKLLKDIVEEIEPFIS
ncbi:MAG: hypothetical protein V4594_22510 [Bacteroidota bacterium]